MTYDDVFDMPVLSRSIFVMLLVFSTLVLSTACSGELDPADPKDAYNIFRSALFSGDSEVAWERTDEQTRRYFEERYEKLEEMDDLIERYLPHTDHEIARGQSGAELLAELDSGRDLFAMVFQPAEFIDDPAVEFGAEAHEIQMAEHGQAAVVVTRGGQEFVMVLDEEDDQWHVNLVESGDFLDQSFQWLAQNENALVQTVEDLIAEERRVREEIISSLMTVDSE